MDSVCSTHATYNLKDYIYSNLNNLREKIETASGNILHICGAGTVAIKIIINGIPSYIHLKNVHYCPEMDSNLLSLGILEAKNFEFKAKNGFLNVKNTAEDVVLQFKREGTVYPVAQPENTFVYYIPATIQVYRATRAQSFELCGAASTSA